MDLGHLSFPSFAPILFWDWEFLLGRHLWPWRTQRVDPRGEEAESVGFGFAQTRPSFSMIQSSSPERIRQASWEEELPRREDVPVASVCSISWDPDSSRWGTEGRSPTEPSIPSGPWLAGVLIFLNYPKDPVTKNKVKPKWSFLSFRIFFL